MGHFVARRRANQWFGLRSPRYVPLSRAIRAAAAVVLVGLAVHSSPARESIETHVSHRIEFAVREALHLAPTLNARLKILVYDDAAVSGLGTFDLDLDDWATVLEALAAQQPRAILIDKLFDKPQRAEDAARFTERLRRLAVPVVAGAFMREAPISWRKELGIGPRGHAYGPLPELREAFATLGHIIYDGHGKATPELELAGNRTLPHASLALATPAERSLVPVDRHGRMLIDALPQKVVAARTIGMKAVVLRARSGKPIPVVEPGDLVLILPGLYTGSGDWVDTPAGNMPGGFFLAAAVSSWLSGAWLRPVEEHGLGIVAAGALGFAIGLLLWGRAFWVALGSAMALIVLGGIGLFALAGVVVPWLSAGTVTYVTATVIYVMRALVARIEQVRMESELSTAQLVQKCFYPRRHCPPGALMVAGASAPSSECSGDWWSHEILPDGRHLVLIGDAMGHGAPAALLTAMAFSACTLLARGADASLTAAGLLKKLNCVVHAALDSGFTMSFQAATFDLAAGIMTLANAGHPTPLLLRGDEKPRSIIARGSLLGLDATLDAEPIVFALEPGDRLLFYTDGMIECGSPSPGSGKAVLSKRFGRSDVKASAQAVVDSLLEAKRLDLDGDRPDDDITAVVAFVGADWRRSATPISETC